MCHYDAKKFFLEYFVLRKKWKTIWTLVRAQGGYLQNFLSKFARFFVTLRCFYKQVFIENRYLMIYTIGSQPGVHGPPRGP